MYTIIFFHLVDHGSVHIYKLLLGSTEIQTSPLTMGVTSVHNVSNMSYDFGGPFIPPGHQSLNKTFSGASTSALVFHYPMLTGICENIVNKKGRYGMRLYN
jgi:hypothetical protein